MTEFPYSFRKKPVVVEAWRWTVDETQLLTPEWLDKAIEKWPEMGGITFEHEGGLRFAIATLEGVMIGDVGDWIIQGVAGELYPCKPDIFEQTYEPVT